MAHPIPNDPEALLTRAMAAEALSAAGYPVKRGTLATKASRGGGPRFRRFGKKPLYRWGDALEWAQSLLSPPMSSTSEASAEGKSRPAMSHARHRSVVNPNPISSDTAICGGLLGDSE